jgi:hypothetical protein
MLRKTLLAVPLLATALAAGAVAGDEPELSWLPSLVTDTPGAGLATGIVMARRGVTTNPAGQVGPARARPAHANDPDSLIEASGVVAAFFGTIAAANDYWRE